MRRWTIVATLLAGLLLAGSVQAGQAKPSLDDLTRQLAAWTYGKSRTPKVEMADRIRAAHGEPAERKKLIGALVDLLKSKDATAECKQFCCEQLSIVGGRDVVPELAGLLSDPKMHHWARMGLERISDDKAAAALRDFLPQAEGKLLIGTVNSLGERRDAKAAPALAKLLGHKNPDVVKKAAIALGKIGGPEATAALEKAAARTKGDVRRAVVGGWLRCADHLVAAGKKDQAWAIYKQLYSDKEPQAVRVAALRGLVNADRRKAAPILARLLTGDDARMRAIATEFVRETKDPAETKQYVALLPKMDPEARALLIGALADRGDPTALPAIVEAAKSDNPTVRQAALRALADLGDASSVPMLASLAAAGERAAAESLHRLSGKEADGAVLKLLDHDDAATRKVAVRAAAARRMEKAVPKLLALARDKDASVRIEALRALGTLGEKQHLPALVERLVAAQGQEQREAEQAVREVCSRVADPAERVAPLLAAMPKADVSAQCAILRLMGRVGGDPALQATRNALNADNAQVREAALRALANWVDPSPAADLKNIVKTAEDTKTKVIAFRGYLHAADLRARKSVDQGLKMYREAIKLAPRPEEKKSVLGSVGKVRHPAALTLALEYLDDKQLQAEAAAAVKNIARHIRRRHRKQADAALKKVRQATGRK
ncbi:MAG: HEAT repeat domain-containing protein [Planctomycetota bacterium]